MLLRIIKKFNKLLNKHQQSRIIVLFFMMLVGAMLEAMGVGLMLPIVSSLMNDDLLETNEYAAFVADLFGITSIRTFTILAIALMIFVFVIKDLYIIFETYVQNKFIYNNKFATQSRIMRAYMNLPYEYFLSATSSEVLRVEQADVMNVFNLLNTLLSFFSETIVALTLIITIFIIDPFITTVVAIVILASIIIIILFIRPRMKNAGNMFISTSTDTNKWILQMVSGVKEIKIADTLEYFQENFEDNARKNVKAAMFNNIWNATPKLIIEMMSICSVLIVVTIQIYSGLQLSSLVSVLSAFVMAAARLLPAANRAVNAYNGMTYYEPALDSMIEVLSVLESTQEKKEVALQIGKKFPDKFIDKIILNKITYKYPEGEDNILIDATMDIPIGSSIGIVGESGAGKTTAVDILLGLLKPESGIVTVDGIEIKNNYKEWLSHVGYIPQSIFMLDSTIRENIVFGHEQNDEKVWKALKEAKLDTFVKAMPEGLNTGIGERGIRLSGGQIQRIGIARALYHEPDILVFDEATSALDNETEAAIMDSINALHGKKTIIIIAHRLSTIKECDIVYRVKNKKIARER